MLASSIRQNGNEKGSYYRTPIGVVNETVDTQSGQRLRMNGTGEIALVSQ